ncbi:MAG: hypothetical protein ACKVQB_06175 [Bacteroidia bacterium]
MIENYKNDVGYWKDKYYRLKAKFIKIEQRIEVLIRKPLHPGGKSNFNSGSTLGNVWGGDN